MGMFKRHEYDAGIRVIILIRDVDLASFHRMFLFLAALNQLRA